MYSFQFFMTIVKEFQRMNFSDYMEEEMNSDEEIPPWIIHLSFLVRDQQDPTRDDLEQIVQFLLTMSIIS